MNRKFLFLFIFLFVITIQGQSLTSIQPDSGKQGSQFSVTITGENNNWWTTDYMSLYFSGGGISVFNKHLVNSNQINASINISDNASLGTRDLHLYYEGISLVLNNAFTVLDSVIPSITSVYPSSSVQGSNNVDINIYSVDTEWSSEGGNSVEIEFSGNGINVNSVTVTSITGLIVNIDVDSTATIGTHQLTIKHYFNNNLLSTASSSFYVESLPPELVSIEPNSGKQGQQFGITITGEHTNWWTTDYMSIYFSGNGINVSNKNIIDENHIGATIKVADGADIGLRNLHLDYYDGKHSLILNNAFTVEDSVIPIIKSISPNTINQGDSNVVIDIYGEDTEWSNIGSDSLDINITNDGILINSINVLSLTHLQLNVSVAISAPTGSCQLHIKHLRNSSLISDLEGGIFINITPLIIGFEPSEGSPGDFFQVTLTGINVNWRTSPYSFIADIYLSGTGVSVTNESIVNTNTISANLSIDNDAEEGYRTVYFKYHNGYYNNYTLTFPNGFFVRPVGLCGDADEDGTVYAFDASLVLRYSLGTINLSDQGAINANVDEDTLVSAFDAALILRHVIGLPEPVETCFGSKETPWNLPEEYKNNLNITTDNVSGTTYDFRISGINDEDHILSLTFDMELSEPGEAEIVNLPEGYVTGINRIDSLHYRVGAINAEGLSSDDMLFRIDFAEELGIVTLSNIRLNGKLLDGTTGVSGEDDVIKNFKLVGNYPNPFNPSTKIVFEVPRRTNVKIEIYDVLGRKIRTLVNDAYSQGRYEVSWNGKNERRNKVASGMYIAVMRAGNYRHSIKMNLLK